MRPLWTGLTLGALIFAFVLSAPAQDIENLITNPDFENDTQDWSTYGAAPLVLSGRADAHGGSRAAEIEVPAPGANFWDSGFQYMAGSLVFNEGVQYTWAFFAKSEPPVEINIKPELGQDPWTAYGEKRANLTEEYQEFYTEWQTPLDVVPASLTLHIQFDAATLWFDDVRWYEGEYVPFEGEPQAVEPEGKAATTWGALKGR